MSKKLVWLNAVMGCSALMMASTCLASVQALDDQALTEVRGAGVDKDIMGQLTKGHTLPAASDEQRKNASSPQNTAALLAALDLQTRQSAPAAGAAIKAVNTGIQLGGTLLALTPVSALIPIGLPLFGLPQLPPSNNR